MALDRQLPAHRGFNLIARTPGAEIGRQAQAGQLLHGLVGRTIFPQTDRVMGIHHDLPRFHQCRHARCVARIFNEHQEGGGIGYESTVMSDTIGNGGHTEFTHAIVNVIARQILFQ